MCNLLKVTITITTSNKSINTTINWENMLITVELLIIEKYMLVTKLLSLLVQKVKKAYVFPFVMTAVNCNTEGL